MSARSLMICVLLLVSATSPASAEHPRLSDAKAQKAAVKCQKAIDQAGAKLSATKLKNLDACSTAVLACIQTKPGNDACIQKATAKCSKALLDAIPQAEVKLAAKIVKSCGAPLRPADLLAGDGLGIGAQAGACNADFGLNVCQDVGTLAQCLVAEHSRAAARLFATEQPRASELIAQALAVSVPDLPEFPGCQDCSQVPSETTGKAVTACGAAVTKAGRTFAAAVGKGLGTCIDTVFACLQIKAADPKCLAKARSTCDATAGKLATARTKLAAAIDKRCAATAGLPFTTLATAPALNLDALAAECDALGVATLASVGDYVACIRRQHECRVAGVLRNTLPRTTELLDAGLLDTAADLLDAAACPASLPSESLTTLADARAAHFFGLFKIARFLSMTKRILGGPGLKATTVGSKPPSSSPNAPRRIAFPLGAPGRFVPGSSRIVKVTFGGITKSTKPLVGAAAAAPSMMIVGVKRGDLEVEDHLEIPLDPNDDGEIELAIDYAGDPPSCVFDLDFAVSEGGVVSDYTTAEQVSDTVPPPTATPVPTATAGATAVPTTNVTSTSTALATPTATATTATATPTTTPSATAPTATATPGATFAYALTTNDDPVAPGGVASLTLTVTNLRNAPQNATLSFTVPAFTFFGAFGPGAVRNVAFSNVAAGTSQSAIVNLTVQNAAEAPPDGTAIVVTFSDAARGASVSRTFITDASPAAGLALATADATVVPGGTFRYALAYHNAGISPLSNAELSVAVPAGASFVDAEGGVVPGIDGIVRWPLGTLAGNAAGQRTVTFAAAADARAAYVVAAELRDGNAATLAHASAATAVYANPIFAYSLTTSDDAVAPARTALYRLTVTNLTNAAQDATLSFRVPDFTTYGAFGAGAVRSVAFPDVAPGASESVLLALVVNNGASAPPEGTVLPFTVQDTARGIALTRAIVARGAPAAELTLATTHGTVAPGGAFAYTLAYHNPGIQPVDDVELGVRVPAGTSFVAATEGAVPDADGVVRWPLGTLGGNTSGQRRVTFAANAGARGPLLVEAALRRVPSGDVITQASAATDVYANPVFAYTLTSIDDAVAPGHTALFRLTVTNLTNAAQDATLSFRVPDFTTYGAFGAGAVRSVAFAGVAAGASESALLPLVVTSGAAAPPDGTVIGFAVDDDARGAALSRIVVADSAPAAELTLTTTAGTIAPGGSFAYTLVYSNPNVAPLPFTELAVRVPHGASFVGADEGVTPDSDGVLRWPIGTLAGNAGGERSVVFTAGANATAPLLVEADVHDGSTHAIITQASAATAVYANPAFAYRLTTTDDDPIVPGRTASFLLTVTNLTNAARDATVYFRVPEFTTYGAFGAGAIRSVAFAAVAAGASQSALLPLVVTSGAAAPPDGTVIALAVDDAERAGTVARAIVTDASGRAELKLSTTQATVAPGGVFAYTSSFHNTQASALFGVELGMPIPAGASFVSADDGVTPGADGVLRWPLGTLAGGAGGKRTVTLTAGAATAAPLLVEAVLRDASADVVAHASATTSVYATPTFSYSLTTAADTIAAGQTVTFTLQVTNLTNTSQTAILTFRVPDFTTYGAFGAGAVRSVTFSDVAAGAPMETSMSLLVTSGAQAPPSGTLIDLTTTDGARGASVSRTVTVN